MGRTNPTYRDLLSATETRWEDYRRTLRRRDQRRFERLFVYARDHADAAGMLNHEDRLAPVLMSIALEQERRLDELERRVETLDETTETPDGKPEPSDWKPEPSDGNAETTGGRVGDREIDGNGDGDGDDGSHG